MVASTMFADPDESYVISSIHGSEKAKSEKAKS